MKINYDVYSKRGSDNNFNDDFLLVTVISSCRDNDTYVFNQSEYIKDIKETVLRRIIFITLAVAAVLLFHGKI